MPRFNLAKEPSIALVVMHNHSHSGRVVCIVFYLIMLLPLECPARDCRTVGDYMGVLRNHLLNIIERSARSPSVIPYWFHVCNHKRLQTSAYSPNAARIASKSSTPVYSIITRPFPFLSSIFTFSPNRRCNRFCASP